MFTKKRLQEMDWHLFERLCFLIFDLRGVNIQHVGSGPDDGIDLNVYKKGKVAIVQCKGGSQIVTVVTMRAHYGVWMKLKYLDGVATFGAIVMCANRFSDGAMKFAKLTNIVIYDGDEILEYLFQLPDIVHKKLFAKLMTDGWNIPSCPKCRVKMVERKNSKTKQYFYGCPNFSDLAIKCDENMNYKFPKVVHI